MERTKHNDKAKSFEIFIFWMVCKKHDCIWSIARQTPSQCLSSASSIFPNVFYVWLFTCYFFQNNITHFVPTHALSIFPLYIIAVAVVIVIVVVIIIIFITTIIINISDTSAGFTASVKWRNEILVWYLVLSFFTILVQIPPRSIFLYYPQRIYILFITSHALGLISPIYTEFVWTLCLLLLFFFLILLFLSAFLASL